MLATVVSLAAVVSSFSGAELALRIGRRRLVTIVMLSSLMVSAVVGFSASLPFAAVIAICLVYAVAIQADFGLADRRCRRRGAGRHRGATLAVHSTVGFSGAFFAPLVVGLVLDHAGGRSSTTAWGLGFLAMGLMGAVGFACFALLVRRSVRSGGSRT